MKELLPTCSKDKMIDVIAQRFSDASDAINLKLLTTEEFADAIYLGITRTCPNQQQQFWNVLDKVMERKLG